MTRSDRALLQKVEWLLKTKKKIFVGEAGFSENPNLPEGAIVICDERLTGRLRDDGYITFEDEPWRFDKKTSETGTLRLVARVVKRLTDQWAREKRDYYKHLVAIAALVVGILGAALTIFRAFCK